jgi:hypothetical protein
MRGPAMARPVSDGADDTGDGSDRAATAVSSYARTAGISGVLFAALLVTTLVFLAQVPDLGVSDNEYTTFYRDGGGHLFITVGLYLVPFAGIAFLWHMMATRTMLQVRRPASWAEIAHWLQLASGVIFVTMLFAGAATAGAVALLTRFSEAEVPGADVGRALSSVGYTLVFVFGVKSAGMYMLATTGLARSAGVLPAPVIVLSYLLALFLLVSATFHPAILLAFPTWVLLVSVLLLVRPPARSHQ